VLGEIITEKIDGPAVFNIAEVAGAVHQELLDVGGDALPKGSRPTRLRCVV
jgi:hypothetical protein